MFTRRPLQLPEEPKSSEEKSLLKSFSELRKTIVDFFSWLNTPGAVYLTQATVEDSTIANTTLTSPTISDATVTNATITLANGTAAAPSLAFASDTNTGIYRYGSDTFGIAAGGNAAFTVSYGSNGDANLYGPAGITSTTGLNIYADSALGVLRMRSPSHIVRPGTFEVLAPAEGFVVSVNSVLRAHFESSLTSITGALKASGLIESTSSGFKFPDGTTQTTAASATNWASPGTIGSTTANSGSFTTLTTSSTVTHNGGTANGVAYLDGSKVLTSGSTLVFDGSGLGIGTNNPSSVRLRIIASNTTGSGVYDYLSCTNDADSDFVVAVTGSGATDKRAVIGTKVNTALAFQTNATEGMRITGGGEVYIAGTTDQGAYNLQVNGTGVWGAGAYTNGSDARIKEDVAPLDEGLATVTKLRPVTFRYKSSWSKDTNVQPGFIAQELQQDLSGKAYVDGVVQEGPEYMSVAYQTLIPVLVKAIQELNAKVESLSK